MKTVYQQIKESPLLDEEVKDKALKELRKICETRLLSKKCNFIREQTDNLSNIMSWHPTPSGSQFWSKINQALLKQKA